MKKIHWIFPAIIALQILFVNCSDKKITPLPEEGKKVVDAVTPDKPAEDEAQPKLMVAAAMPEFLEDDLPIDSLKKAMAYSRRYLTKKSIQRAVFNYGDETYTAAEILFSYDLFEKLLDEYRDKETFLEKLNRNFLILKSPGTENTGTVLFTGYYEPVIEGSRKKNGIYNIPAYSVPSDLKTLYLEKFRPDLKGRTIKYRNENGKIVPYHSRREITEQNALKDKSDVVMWFKDPVDLFFMQIQGSGIAQTPEGELVRLGYAGANGKPYRSIGRHLIENNVMDKDTVSMQNIKKYLNENPSEIGKVLNINESYTFFEEQDIAEGPFGSINVPVTPGRSIATDALLFPKAALGFIVTEIPNCDEEGVCSGTKKISRFIVNQDTGGAIKGFGRADIFWGRGKKSAAIAGRMKYYGDMYFIVVKKHLLKNIS